jgi:hypothetical protein
LLETKEATVMTQELLRFFEFFATEEEYNNFRLSLEKETVT